MIRTVAASALVLLCLGCGGGGDDAADESSSASPSATSSTSSTSESTESSAPTTAATTAAPDEPSPTADASRVTGTGYSFVAPEGWGPPPQPIAGFDPDSFAVDLGDSDSFTDNVNVILSPAGKLTADQIEGGIEAELSGAGFKDVTLDDRVQIAGSEAVHVTALASLNDSEYTVDQFYPTDDDQTFVLTFSFSTTVTAKERAAVTDQVLTTWEWTD